MKILDYIRHLFSHNEYKSEYIRDREAKPEAVERDRVRHDNKQKSKVTPLCPFNHTKYCNNWKLELNKVCEDYQKCIVFQELREQRQLECIYAVQSLFPGRVNCIHKGDPVETFCNTIPELCTILQKERCSSQDKCKYLIDNPAEIGNLNHGLCVRDCSGPYLCVDDPSLCKFRD